MATLNKQFFLRQRPAQKPTTEDIGLREIELKPLMPGQLLIKNEYFSIDPAIRGWMKDEPSYMPPIELDAVIRSSTVGTVIESQHDDYSVGDVIYGINGWEQYSVSDGYFLNKIPQDNSYPQHYYLSIFGAVGLTAYFGISDCAELKPGDTLLMSAAAGAVGSLGGQIAKMMGCKVVGLAGSEEKCRWITEELGFDAAINYKTDSGRLVEAMKQACPDGVDVFFDNVGGEILDAALLNLNDHARVVFCGAISSYNTSEPVPGPYNWWQILAKSAVVKGYLVSNYFDRFDEGAQSVAKLLEAGKLQFKDEIIDGFEHTLEAFLTLFDGSNAGKLILKL